jgi:hypothetical protein
MGVRRNTDRHKASEEGRKFYVSSTACKKCGCVIKYVSSYGCHHCNVIKGRQKLADGACEKYHTPENTRRRLRKWRQNNPDKVRDQYDRDETKNVRAAKRRAAKRNQTPDLTLEEKSAIITLYNKAKHLSETTGTPHEIDHIVPICEGGLHHPDNLQILTRHDNRKKGRTYL